jgi:TetR/AcrR family transcriptional regulator, regulator of cefoperazone and chloramphenicol sensitivity
MKSPNTKREDTSDRIIAAAGAVFAERGFRGTTIRQITARAGVNVAAVNYHFRDKGELYVRVLREAKRTASQIVIDEIPGTAEQRLCGFIEQFVRNLLNPDRPAWQGRVIVMEMANPSPALNVIIREITEPLYRGVRGLIAELASPDATEADLDLMTLSVFGQCVFYASCRPMVENVARHLGRVPDRTAAIAAHIGAFSVSALKNFHRSPVKKSANGAKRRSKTLTLR